MTAPRSIHETGPAGIEPAPDAPRPGTIRRVLGTLGPGIIMAATVIGASHVILSPVAGARFGYGLIWLVLFSHLFKYPAFDFGPRFAVARGVSLIQGFQLVPGPRNWAVVVFLITTTLQGLTVTTGIMSVTASILLVNFGTLPFPLWIVAIGSVIIALHSTGKYAALQALSKVMMGTLAGITALAFFLSKPELGELGRIFVPTIPEGSTTLAASILGLMPAGVNVAIWHSLWAVEHLKYWEKTAKSRREMLGMGLTDLRVGYLLSAVLAAMFISLGAKLLRPRGLTPDGLDVALTLSKIYTELFGQWMYPVFMVAVFAAMFSTAYTVMDGFPRAFSTILKMLFPANETLRRSSNPSYWIFMILLFGFVILTNTLLPNPVLLVGLVGLLSLLVAPVLYSLNYYCATRLIPDEHLRPSPLLRAWALAGIALMTLAAGFYVYTQVGR